MSNNTVQVKDVVAAIQQIQDLCGSVLEYLKTLNQNTRMTANIPPPAPKISGTCPPPEDDGEDNALHAPKEPIQRKRAAAAARPAATGAKKK